MREIYPESADRVSFYAVSYSLNQSLEDVNDPPWINASWPWPVAEPVGTLIKDLRIVISSTKIGIDSRGVIIYRGGFGEGTVETWRKVLQKLAATG